MQDIINILEIRLKMVNNGGNLTIKPIM